MPCTGLTLKTNEHSNINYRCPPRVAKIRFDELGYSFDWFPAQEILVVCRALY